MIGKQSIKKDAVVQKTNIFRNLGDPFIFKFGFNIIGKRIPIRDIMIMTTLEYGK